MCLFQLSGLQGSIEHSFYSFLNRRRSRKIVNTCFYMMADYAIIGSCYRRSFVIIWKPSTNSDIKAIILGVRFDLMFAGSAERLHSRAWDSHDLLWLPSKLPRRKIGETFSAEGESSTVSERVWFVLRQRRSDYKVCFLFYALFVTPSRKGWERQHSNRNVQNLKFAYTCKSSSIKWEDVAVWGKPFNY